MDLTTEIKGRPDVRSTASVLFSGWINPLAKFEECDA